MQQLVSARRAVVGRKSQWRKGAGEGELDDEACRREWATDFERLTAAIGLGEAGGAGAVQRDSDDPDTRMRRGSWLNTKMWQTRDNVMERKTALFVYRRLHRAAHSSLTPQSVLSQAAIVAVDSVA
jgi:hypothetical protein